ncbi:MAG: hypothetical protein IJP61_02310 [Treponema sp.]|nr:hypothetical protein [Treponema sp.]
MENGLEQNDSNSEAENDIIECKKLLIQVMEKENKLLDKILELQTVLHQLVRDKKWETLNRDLDNLQIMSDQFVELEEERESLSVKINISQDREISPVLTQVRGKLQKSKIENHALNEYITTTRKFLQGVFDSVVPQRRNIVYSNKGEIVRPELKSLVIDQIL